ncbi:MAG: VWA domain-containing protein [Candidatus Lokiarchaeota archaeon]
MSERIPENIVICLDTSRVMYRDDYKPNRLESCKKAIKILVEERINSDPSTNFCLLTFSDSVEKLVDFTSLPSQLLESLDQIQVKGGSVLGEALAISIKLLIEELRKIAAKVPRILIISDGNYSNTAVDPIKMARLCHGLKIKIDCFKIGDLNHLNILKRITDLSKGKYIYNNDSATLHETAKNYANSNLKAPSLKSESIVENPAFLRQIAANLFRVQDLTKDQEQKVKQLRGVVDYKKCSICFSDKDPITNASFFISGRYCPNCQTPFHINCLAEWATSQEDANLRSSGTVRCPHCFYLLRIPSEVTQVKRLKILSKKELHKQVGAEPSEVFKVIRNKAATFGEEALYNSCPVCNMIFEEHQDVVKCGNPDCGTLYHIDCFKKLNGQCKSCGARLEL